MRWTVLCLTLFALPAYADPVKLIGPFEPNHQVARPCDEWLDKDDDGRRDKDEHSHFWGTTTTTPPDETQTTTADSMTQVTKTWRRLATEDDYVDPGTPIVERMITVTNANGQVVEEKWEADPPSDGHTKSFQYDSDGRLTETQQDGPGNSSVTTTFAYDSDGYLVKVTTSAAMGAYNDHFTETAVIREGTVIVRTESGDYSTGTDSEGRPANLVPTSFRTFEYDDQLRVVAKRDVTINSSGVLSIATYRLEYDCPK